jgi:hypothetical protein
MRAGTKATLTHGFIGCRVTLRASNSLGTKFGRVLVAGTKQALEEVVDRGCKHVLAPLLALPAADNSVRSVGMLWT